MLFAFICKDKPGHLQVRLDTRPDHVAFLKELNAGRHAEIRRPVPRRRRQAERQPGGDRGGRQGRGRKPIAASDPYAKAGLFESVEIQRLELGLQQSGERVAGPRRERTR